MIGGLDVLRVRTLLSVGRNLFPLFCCSTLCRLAVSSRWGTLGKSGWVWTLSANPSLPEWAEHTYQGWPRCVIRWMKDGMLNSFISALSSRSMHGNLKFNSTVSIAPFEETDNIDRFSKKTGLLTYSLHTIKFTSFVSSDFATFKQLINISFLFPDMFYLICKLFFYFLKNWSIVTWPCCICFCCTQLRWLVNLVPLFKWTSSREISHGLLIIFGHKLILPDFRRKDQDSPSLWRVMYYSGMGCAVVGADWIWS